MNDFGIKSLKINSKHRLLQFNQILQKCRENKVEKYGSAGQWFMIAGMPNCGKSNIINSIRINSKAFNSNHVAKSHDKACVTTYANGFKVSEKPLCFLYDSPGILLPTIENGEMAYNLGLDIFFRLFANKKKNEFELLDFK